MQASDETTHGDEPRGDRFERLARRNAARAQTEPSRRARQEVASRLDPGAVGWALTAITCLVLGVGVAIIRQLGGGSPRVTDDRPPVGQVSDDAIEQGPDANTPLVLRPVAPQAEPEAPRVAELPADDRPGGALRR
jgi:hypothetical protein